MKNENLMIFDESKISLTNEEHDEIIKIITNISPITEGFSDKRLDQIDTKIKEAAYTLRTFGTLTKQASFINGAKWAIHNLTSDEIKYFKDNTNKDDTSFFGL